MPGRTWVGDERRVARGRHGRVVHRRGVLNVVQLDLAADRLELAPQVRFRRLLRGVRELRDDDRCQNAEDHDHDQNFDQCESLAHSGESVSTHVLQLLR